MNFFFFFFFTISHFFFFSKKKIFFYGSNKSLGELFLSFFSDFPQWVSCYGIHHCKKYFMGKGKLGKTRIQLSLKLDALDSSRGLRLKKVRNDSEKRERVHITFSLSLCLSVSLSPLSLSLSLSLSLLSLSLGKHRGSFCEAVILHTISFRSN